MEQVLFEQNDQIRFFIYVISGILGAVISSYLLRIYRLFSSVHIFALLIGFALISFGDFFFSGTIEAIDDEKTFNFLHWLQLYVVSYGLVFIGLVYYYQKSSEKRFSLVIKTALVSLFLIGLTIVIFGIQDTLIFPQFQRYNEYFRIANMVALGYVVFRTFDNSDLKNRKDLILMPLGFGILFLGQFERFLFAIDPASLTLITSGVLKVAGLGVIILALHRKTKSKLAGKLIRHEA